MNPSFKHILLLVFGTGVSGCCLLDGTCTYTPGKDGGFTFSTTRCERIPSASSITVSESGLDTTVLNIPIKLAAANFSRATIDRASQELRIFSEIALSNCRRLQRVPGDSSNYVILANQDRADEATLGQLAMTLSQATNDEQIDAAIVTAQNSSNATKTQTDVAAAVSSQKNPAATLSSPSSVAATTAATTAATGATEAVGTTVAPVTAATTAAAASNAAASQTQAAAKVLGSATTTRELPSP